MKIYKIFILSLLTYLFILDFKSLLSAQETCPLDNSWRVTPAFANVPTSASIITTQPAVTFRYNKDELRYMALWGYSNTSITVGPVDNSIIITYPKWATNTSYLVGKYTPTIKANTNYQFSIDFKLGELLNTYNKISTMSILFFNQKDINPNASSQYFSLNNRVPIYNKTFTSVNFTSSTDFQSIIIPFTPTIDIAQSVFALQINHSSSSTGPNISTFIIKDFKLTLLSKPIPSPTLLTKDSELVILPKPKSALDSQSNLTCPYLATDLVHWHNPSTWASGVVPLPSTSIVIPAGKRVLISPCSISQTAIYTKITVPVNSELIFADADMTLNVKDILVQGKFTMGTTKCRYNAKINIIFHGSKTTSDTIAQYFGSKGIAVASTGFISVHGKQYHNTWTKLSATAWTGNYVINVQDTINWEVGQQVVVTTSVYKDEIDVQNEVMTIAAIKGKKIQFTQPLRFYHYGGQEYQSEVALLSRRIIFRSNDADTTQFGGHVLVNGEGQFAGIQLIKMGQTNMKARYPLHFHLSKVVNNSYISDCSVTESYYRCYTIHGTNNLTITRNVAYDIIGHCYYIEDGVEMDNTLSYNFVSYVHSIGKPSGGGQEGEITIQNVNITQPADSAASGFYITNAWNSFIGNAASGGWAGYSIINLERPIGNHANVDIVPKFYPLKQFEGNSAHSSGYFSDFGAAVYVGGNLTLSAFDGLLYYNSGRFSRGTFFNGTSAAGNERWLRFNNTKVFLANRGIQQWGLRGEVVNFEGHDCTRGTTLLGQIWFSNAIVNGQSNNLLSRNTGNRQGFQFYDTLQQTILSNVNFRNYYRDETKQGNLEADNRAIISMTHSDGYKPQGISATINCTTTNVATSQIIGHRVIDTGASRYFNFIDWGSSLIPGKTKGSATIVGAHDSWWNFDNTCSFNQDWVCWVCDKGTREIAAVTIYIPGLIDKDVILPATSYIGNISLFGSGITDRRSMIVTRNAGITGVSNIGWYLNLSVGSPNYFKIWTAQVVFGHYVFLAVPYPPQTTFIISSNKLYTNSYNYNYTLASSAAAVKSGNGTSYYFDQKHLFIKVVNLFNKGLDSESFSRGGAKIYDVHWEFFIHVYAYNTITPPVNGYFKNLPDILPSSAL